ncbi:hypothetical protein [Saccharicrinis sp. FJH54]|uniref:hypothetical protein n=1 Tax=Saccharicrinis sp. FJH54 TaxID=3344665 RepID=UPI0035D44B93
MKPDYKIGYIDEDINQVRKYQRRFRKYGFEVIGYNLEKGMNLEELMQQVFNSDIDLLMIDYKLNETNIVTFNGEQVESYFYDKKPLFPHIIFTNKVDQAEPYVEDLKIIFDKDDIFEEEDNDNEKVQYFIETLKRSIEQYRNHIKKKKDTIESLLLKSSNHELTPLEEDELISLQRELLNLDKSKAKEIPEKLRSVKQIKDISKIRRDAEEYLQSLINENKKK